MPASNNIGSLNTKVALNKFDWMIMVIVYEVHSTKYECDKIKTTCVLC